MSKDFNVRLNGVEYNQNNIPEEIQLKGKTEKEDVLSVFDRNKDGTLSSAEIKDAIFSFVKAEQKVSGSLSDGNISDEEAKIIAKEFMGGKYKIGENIQKLAKDLQNRINMQLKQNKKDVLLQNGVNVKQDQVPYTGSLVVPQVYYGKPDGTVVDGNGNIVENMGCNLVDVYAVKDDEIREVYNFYGIVTVNVNDKNQKMRKIIDGNDNIVSLQALNYKGNRYKNEEYSAKVLGLTKEIVDSKMGRILNKLQGKENSYVYTKTYGYREYIEHGKHIKEPLKEYYTWDGEKFVLKYRNTKPVSHMQGVVPNDGYSDEIRYL